MQFLFPMSYVIWLLNISMDSKNSKDQLFSWVLAHALFMGMWFILKSHLPFIFILKYLLAFIYCLIIFNSTNSNSLSYALLFLGLGNGCLQIVHWRNHLKFPEEARLSPEAKDLICRLLCDVQHRLGTKGADEIKVCKMCSSFLYLFLFLL